jgi:hypothetical protein
MAKPGHITEAEEHRKSLQTSRSRKLSALDAHNEEPVDCVHLALLTVFTWPFVFVSSGLRPPNVPGS